MAPPGEVAAQERIAARADDELVAGVVAAATENGALHRRQDVALVGTRRGQLDGPVEGVIRELSGPPHVLELRLALDGAQPAHQVGRVLEITESVQRRLHAPPVEGGQAIGIELDAEPPPGTAVLL